MYLLYVGKKGIKRIACIVLSRILFNILSVTYNDCLIKIMNKTHLFNRFSSHLQNTLNRYSLMIKARDVVLSKDYYLCPISLKLFSVESIKSGTLTLEHVPPESLGGKGLVLVDKEINNKDGHTSDKDLLLFFQTKTFLEHGGELEARISAEMLGMHGVTAQFALKRDAQLESGEAKVQVTTSAKNIKAMEYKGMFSNWDGLSFKVSGKMSKKVNAKLMLKCAYLTVFSRIGYDLLFGKTGFKDGTYGVLIKALNNQNDHFPLIGFGYHAPLEKSNVGVINEPKDYRSLFVNLSFKLNDHVYKYVIFLPHPDEENLDCLNRIKNIPAGQTVNFNISEIAKKI